MATVLATNQMSYSSAKAILNASATSVTRINATHCNVAISWFISKNGSTSYNENKYFHLVTSGTGSNSVVTGASAAIPELSKSTSGLTSLSGTINITLNGLTKTSTSLNCAIGISNKSASMINNGTLVFNGLSNVSSSTYSPAYQYHSLSFSNYAYSVSVSANNNFVSSVSGNATSVAVGTATSINCTLASTTGYTYTFANWSYSNGTQFSTNQNTSINGAAGKSYSLVAYATRSTNSYTATIQSTNTTRGTVSGGGSKNYGTNVTATATAKTGYSFVNWSGTYSSTNNPYTFTMPAKAVTLNATFSVNNYTLTVSSANTSRVTVSGGGSKSYNSSVSAVATLKSITGYTVTFLGWYEGSTKVSSDLTYTFNMPASNKTLVANASVTANSYTLTLANNSVNYISSVTGNGSKSYGSSVTVNAVINSVTGYTTTFTQWTSNNTTLLTNNTSNPFTFNMPAGNVTLTASATRTANQYTTTFNNTVAIRFDTQSSIVTNSVASLTTNTVDSTVFSLNKTSTVQTYDITSNVPSCTLSQAGLKFDSYWTYTNVTNGIKLVTKMPSTWNMTTNSAFIAVLYGSQRTFTKPFSGVNKYDGTLKYQLVNNSWQIVGN